MVLQRPRDEAEEAGGELQGVLGGGEVQGQDPARVPVDQEPVSGARSRILIESLIFEFNERKREGGGGYGIWSP